MQKIIYSKKIISGHENYKTRETSHDLLSDLSAANNQFKEERPRESCGVFAVYDYEDAAKMTYFGLYALQHRGQESAGIVTTDGRCTFHHKGMGLVNDVFNESTLETKLKGNTAIGHVRYSTSGSSQISNAQPFVSHHHGSTIAVAHNGNIVNAHKIREKLELKGSLFQSTMDTEVVAHLMAQNFGLGFEQALCASLKELQGAYSLVLLTENAIVGARDPNGFRPLCLGKLDRGYVLASETCALDLVDAKYIRDIEPGELIIINKNGITSLKPHPTVKCSSCIFEFIYFARPDSDIFNHNVYLIRKELGRRLAMEMAGIDADFVMPFPDSGNYAAIGFAHESSIPLEFAMIRNHYVGRTFIQPSQSMRDFSAKIKLNPVKDLIKGKKIIIIEDSIIRGTTCRTRIKNLKELGAKEIHMGVSCPPHMYPCPYGIDFSTRGELIAARHSVEEIRRFIGLDTLNYLSIDGLRDASPNDKNGYCMACFNGEYPVPFDKNLAKLIMEC